jgi:hypothetical protein
MPVVLSVNADFTTSCDCKPACPMRTSGMHRLLF